jgi:hypothetical protein
MRGRPDPLGDLGSGDAMSWPTEAERQARLHKRAGCDCTEEEAMPEDQFDGIAYGLCPIQHAPAAACDSCDDIATALRAAVEAEREGCWQAVLALSSDELRAYDSASSDATQYGRHLDRHGAFADAIAAILARRESE